MKHDLSFAVLAATVFAGLFLSLVDPSTSRDNPAAAAPVAVMAAPATVSGTTTAPATTSGALTLAEP